MVVVTGRAVVVVVGAGAVVVVDGGGPVVVVLGAGTAVVVVDSTGAVVVVDVDEVVVPWTAPVEALELPAIRIVAPPAKPKRLTAARPWRRRFRPMPGNSAPHLRDLCELDLSFQRFVGIVPFCPIKAFSNPARGRP